MTLDKSLHFSRSQASPLKRGENSKKLCLPSEPPKACPPPTFLADPFSLVLMFIIYFLFVIVFFWALFPVRMSALREQGISSVWFTDGSPKLKRIAGTQ